MNFRSALWLLLLLTFYRCKDPVKPESTVVTAEEKKVEEPTIVGDCYVYTSGKDSILLHVVVENNSATGHLHYLFFEKDKSTGNLFGTMRGDTLVADYKFISEGTESEREVAFIRRGETFVEGTGEVAEAGGRMLFKDQSTLKFEGTVLNKTDCNGIARYFNK